MPGSWTSIETNFPTFTGKETVTEQITALQNYMYILTEQLKYNLSNLNSTNWNSKALDELTKSISNDAIDQLGSITEQLSRLNGSVDGLTGRISGLAGTVTDHGGRIKVLEESSAELSAGVEENAAGIQQLQEDASYAEQRLDDLGDRVTAIEEATDALAADVDDLDTRMTATEDENAELVATVEDLKGTFRRIWFTADGSEPEDWQEGDIWLTPE